MLINGVHALNPTQLIINAYTLIVALMQSWACYRIKQTAQSLPKGLLRTAKVLDCSLRPFEAAARQRVRCYTRWHWRRV